MAANPPETNEPRLGFMARLVRPFVKGQLSILLMILAVAMGAAAIWLTPREEEPQIVVPLADVMVSAPGASAAEVERLVTTPLERLLWQIDGVEHVYSLAGGARPWSRCAFSWARTGSAPWSSSITRSP